MISCILARRRRFFCISRFKNDFLLFLVTTKSLIFFMSIQKNRPYEKKSKNTGIKATLSGASISFLTETPLIALRD